MTKRKNFYPIFKEAANNAVKYSGCKNLYVKMHVTHRQMEMKITDDGAGFDMAKIKMHSSQSLSGNGLLNMEIRAKEMKGNLQIHSEQMNGTTVLLKFPLE
jgi:signal transduction histidine kinase